MSQTAGRVVLSIAPDDRYHRHSEGAFLRLKDGRILFAYSRFHGSWEDGGASDIVGIYSSDEGETWTSAETLISASQYNTQNVMSVSLLRMANGDAGMFYGVKQKRGWWRMMLSRSRDECASFYAHTECTLSDRKGHYTFNNDRVERLSTGRLILPLAYSRGSSDISDPSNVWQDCHYFGCYLYSDDDGYTWKEAADVAYPPFTNTTTGLQENGVVEKMNGVLWSYFRTDRMYQYECFSMDGGIHWTVPQPSRFTSPVAPMKIKRNPYTGALYAVWNPIPVYNGRLFGPEQGWGRTPLVFAASADDGVTWSDYTIIEDEPGHGYCYPAIFFADRDTMLIGYCSGGIADVVCLARLSIMKVKL